MVAVVFLVVLVVVALPGTMTRNKNQGVNDDAATRRNIWKNNFDMCQLRTCRAISVLDKSFYISSPRCGPAQLKLWFFGRDTVCGVLS